MGIPTQNVLMISTPTTYNNLRKKNYHSHDGLGMVLKERNKNTHKWYRDACLSLLGNPNNPKETKGYIFVDFG